MYFVENGPFSSHAPQADTSYAALTKEEAEILLTLYGDETAYQYALRYNNILFRLLKTILNLFPALKW